MDPHTSIVRRLRITRYINTSRRYHYFDLVRSQGNRPYNSSFRLFISVRKLNHRGILFGGHEDKRSTVCLAQSPLFIYMANKCVPMYHPCYYRLSCSVSSALCPQVNIFRAVISPENTGVLHEGLRVSRTDSVDCFSK